MRNGRFAQLVEDLRATRQYYRSRRSPDADWVWWQPQEGRTRVVLDASKVRWSHARDLTRQELQEMIDDDRAPGIPRAS